MKKLIKSFIKAKRYFTVKEFESILEQDCDLSYPINYYIKKNTTFKEHVFDDSGIIMWKDNKASPPKFHLTVFADFCLYLLDFVTKNGTNNKQFVTLTKHVDYLKRHQIKEGKHKGGWLTELPQYFSKTNTPYLNASAISRCISVLLRFSILTNDKRFLKVARHAIVPFNKSIKNGGVKGRVFENIEWFEGYPTCCNCHVLNAHCTALLGLYDLYILGGDKNAKVLFDSGIDSLIRALPFYDRGNWFYYGLNGYAKHAMSFGYIIGLPDIFSLLHNLSGRSELIEYRDKAIVYINSPTSRLKALLDKTLWRLKQDIKLQVITSLSPSA